MKIDPTANWYRQELSIVREAKFAYGKRFFPRDIRNLTGTCLYTFTYKGERANDPDPLVLLVGRPGEGPFFRYSPSKNSKAWGTYLAAINLHYLSNGMKNYLVGKFGKLPYIPIGEVRKLKLFYINYRIYRVSKISALSPVYSDLYLFLNSNE